MSRSHLAHTTNVGVQNTRGGGSVSTENIVGLEIRFWRDSSISVAAGLAQHLFAFKAMVVLRAIALPRRVGRRAEADGTFEPGVLCDGFSNVLRSVLLDISVRAIMYIPLVELLVRGISLPAAQLFVIAIENILRGGVGNLTR